MSETDAVPPEPASERPAEDEPSQQDAQAHPGGGLPQGDTVSAAPTDYKRNLWLLLLIIAVVAGAWLIGRCSQQERADKAGPQPAEKGPEAGKGEQEKTPAPLTYEEVLQRQAVLVRQNSLTVVAQPDQFYLLAPPDRGPEGGMQPRVFDVRRRAADFDLGSLLPDFGRMAPVLSCDQQNPPKFVAARDADFMTENDLVLVVTAAGTTRAYPLRVLNTHGAIVDAFGERRVLVAFSWYSVMATGFLLSGSEAQTQWQTTGWLYRACNVLCDSESGSLWDSFAGAAIAGPRVGAVLERIPVSLYLWGVWSSANALVPVLSTDTGFPQVKERGAYAADLTESLQRYLQEPSLPFAVKDFDPAKDRRIAAKDIVVGLQLDDQARAYPMGAIVGAEGSKVTDRLADRTITLSAPNAPAATVTDEQGRPVPFWVMSWFAWKAARPDSQLWLPPTGFVPPAGEPEAAQPPVHRTGVTPDTALPPAPTP